MQDLSNKKQMTVNETNRTQTNTPTYNSNTGMKGENNPCANSIDQVKEDDAS